MAVRLGSSLFSGRSQGNWDFDKKKEFSFIVHPESHQNLLILLLEFSGSLVVKKVKKIN